MANIIKTPISIISIGLILALFGYVVDVRSQTPTINQQLIITKFSVSPEKFTIGQTATITVSAQGENGLKGFRLSVGGKKIDVNCNNQRICTKQITRKFPKTTIRTVTLKLVVVDSTGNTVTQQKNVFIAPQKNPPICDNGSCESEEAAESCSANCTEPKPRKTGFITSDFFGVQAIGSRQEHYDLIDKSFSYMKYLGIGFLFVDGAVWNEIEPNPPVNGVRNYDWSNEDLKFEISKKYGLKIQTSLLSRSDWATTMKESQADEWCCDMFPLKLGYEDDWRAFVKAYVERYYDYGLREITLGNEINAPTHFLEYGGNAKNYDVILSNAYKGAKEANSNIIVGIGFASPGSFFDNNPSENEINLARKRSSIVNNSFSFLENSIKISKNNYDVYTTQCNYNYTGITPFYKWIKNQMQKNGYDKPVFCEHTRSTIYNVKLGSTIVSKLPPYYPDKNRNGVEDVIELLQNPDHTDFEKSKKLYFADQARQTVRKLAVALAGGRERVFIAMSADPYNCQTSRYSWDENWRLTGLIDTRYYCETGDFEKARKPAYHSYKQFIDFVVGANKQVDRLDLGNNVYAYKFIRNNEPLFILWHENAFDTDAAGLVKRQQQITVDLSAYVSSNEVKITRIITELDPNNNPEYSANSIVFADSITIDETPIYVRVN